EADVVLTAELPGVNPDDLDVSVVGDTVTLSGRREPDASDDDARYHRRERWHGDFTRTLQLPFRIDVENVDATFKKGVLMLTLPRADEDRPRRIEIGDGQYRQLEEGQPA